MRKSWFSKEVMWLSYACCPWGLGLKAHIYEQCWWTYLLLSELQSKCGSAEASEGCAKRVMNTSEHANPKAIKKIFQVIVDIVSEN